MVNWKRAKLVVAVVVASSLGMWPGSSGRAEGALNAYVPPIGITVGVIHGQIVRLSLHNLSTETVQVAFALVNFQGINLITGPIDNPISLEPGKGTFVDIPCDTIHGPNDTRAEVTGIVSVVASKKVLKAVDVNLAASLQVLDEATGATLLVLPFANIAGIVMPPV
jgi:hypothetical protein